MAASAGVSTRAGGGRPPKARRTLMLWSVAVLTVGYLMMVQGGTGNMNAHYALIRALADGTPRIDKTLHEVGIGTLDYSVIKGHYYAAKSPGLAFEALPAYLVVKSAGGAKPVADDAKQVWYLTIWGAALPAALLLLLVFFVADGLEPGYGAAAAVTLGVATMVLPFATLFFSHSLSSMLLFAAFAVLWRERRRPNQLSLVFAAGLLAGLAATVEFALAVPGAIIGLYAIARPGWAPRAAAYAAGALLGGLPTLVFNQWAFGTPFKFGGYAKVAIPGANKAGLYGVTSPSFRAAAELLFSPIGLLTLMPVLALGGVGAVLIDRRGFRAEALLIAGISLGTFLLICATNGPLGGGTPGPRYLMPMLPFLALGIAATYKQLPVTTCALAAGSAVQMIVLTLTHPTSAPVTSWYHSLARGDLSQTALDFVGAQRVGIALFVTALALGLLFAAAATVKPVLSLQDFVTAVFALAGWLLFLFRGPQLLNGHALGNGTTAVFVLAASIAFVAAIAPRVIVIGRPLTESKGQELA